ncbi:hypothetical protein LTR36_003591 [Oleoguttula mirabilis]|uniref:PHD-type domain-containing protein n=1 Tax=Oleoguttula mirabilis TaxID=1507867 RepID=A0AAV9JIJ0_9PEZI|nr:hypothetical protein LTR36_003591 [Oleoguttula mirabilis]
MPSRSSEIRDRSLRDRRSTSQDPNVGQPSQIKSTVKEETRKKTFMDQWVEPAIATQPSYLDHNGAPYGVLEHMQPLGEAPNVKVKARVKSEGPRKSVLGRSAVIVGLDGTQETPEGTPAPPAASQAPANGSIQPPIVIDDEKDDDYAPAAKKKEAKPRSRVGKRHSEPASASTKPAKASHKMATPADSAAPQHGKVYNREKLQRVVEAAKQRAMDVGKPDLAAAVNEIWKESLFSRTLTDLLEAILTQTATPSQTAEFQGYVKRAKQRLKDAKEKPRNQPAGGTNATQALPLRSPSKSATTASASTDIRPSAIPSTERTELPRPKLSIKVKSPHRDSKGRRRLGHGGKMTVSPPKKRSGSVGSDSSLTDLTENEDDAMDVDDQQEQAVRAAGPSSKLNGTQPKDHAAERGSLAAPDRKLKRSSADADFEDDERERVIAVKKQKLSKSINREYAPKESDMRKSVREAPPQPRAARPKNGSLIPPPLSLVQNGSRSTSARGSRAVSTDLDSPLSELSPASSRMNTPHIYRGPPKPPPGKRAKTKNSPEKKQLAGYGGLSGAGGAGRESPIGDDDNEELSENNDFCSACGGSGFLLCCDGCDRSFHFSCLDPPLNDDASELNEPWFCYICVAKRPISAEHPEKLQRGVFAPLFSTLKKRNPSTYLLPDWLRDYDQHVYTGKNGDFTESVHPKTRNRAAYDEVPDYFRLQDPKGNAILCYYCHKSSMGQRTIIRCDFCPEHWHLDCLDPPLANPPARSLEGKKIYDWMCPLHVDHELQNIDISMLPPRRTVHLRRPKNPKIVDTALNRGLRNNGIIDILDDASDDSDSEFYDEETAEEGIVYRMPASGIKLDFIDKVKNTRVQAIRSERAFKKARLIACPPSALQQANFARRSFAEQQLALNLAQFANANKDLDLGRDQVENLVGTLIAEAPSEVVNHFMAAENAAKAKSSASTAPPSPPPSDQPEQLSAEQRKELQMLQELIRRKLENSKA